MKKFLIKIINYIRFPNKFWADFYTLLNKPRAKKLGIKFLPPNYIFFDNFNKSSTIIDVGCGYLAEFSCYLIEKFGLNSFAVDPTQKHKEALKNIEEKYKGNFKHLNFAITKEDGKITFNETLDNESGSILTGHQNIRRDRIRSYTVETKNLKSLIKYIGVEDIDFLKLDLEGAEYELLENVITEDLRPFKQLFIEFHHLSVQQYSKKDTKKIVKKISNYGFEVFTLDRINYLFYRK